ncbi:MAG: hypothetical protein SPH77_00640 [Campylobacter sp.]|uniref:hypothetical protein n=1 Tax=Campylobacter sp. TaxID=205 RepID=UPI002A7FA989|nr:hypothetical protein [Campylobacter sp.]MDY4155083.1 hypothetical protein [Campylobacter sp.]MDY6187326.1 hypothetical protein [Campylobacter sp.]
MKNLFVFALFSLYTKPHEIKPKTRKFLRWVVSSEFIFAKKVKHPGYKGDPFLN